MPSLYTRYAEHNRVLLPLRATLSRQWSNFARFLWKGHSIRENEEVSFSLFSNQLSPTSLATFPCLSAVGSPKSSTVTSMTGCIRIGRLCVAVLLSPMSSIMS